MRVIVNDKMKEWVAAYIRAHRKENCISIHVVFSKFNEDFKRTFNIDPQAAIQLLMAEGFIKGSQARGGFSIWLPEDSGKGNGRPFRSRQQPAKTELVSAAEKTEPPVIPAQTGDVEMKREKEKETAPVVIEHRYTYEQIPHPETGKVDVLDLIRHIMKTIAGILPKNPEMDGGYALVRFSVTDVLQKAGVERGQCADFSLVLQAMSLLKSYEGRTWGVLHSRAAEYFITPRSYLVARKALEDRRERYGETRKFREQIAELEAKLAAVSPVDTAIVSTTVVPNNNNVSFETEAIEALAEAERLGEELAQVRAQLTEVQAERDQLIQQLSERPQQAEVIKEAFRERLSALKAVRA